MADHDARGVPSGCHERKKILNPLLPVTLFVSCRRKDDSTTHHTPKKMPCFLWVAVRAST